MKKSKSTTLALTVVILVGSGIAISVAALSQRPPLAPPKASLKDPRTLEEKAKRGRGRLVSNLDFNRSSQKSSLKDMVSSSTLIVIASTESNVCRMSEDGKTVRTFYKSQVEEVLKGQRQAGQKITVSLPGGMVGFPGGVTAEVQTPWFKKMLNNRRYLLFLNGKVNGDTFSPTGGPQGVFEIPADGTGVLSHSGLTKDVMQQYAGKNRQTFVQEIKDAIRAEANQ
ncbi:MAG TPA: hypothetical protein VFS76_06170 [Pyrinomonadaceae bacterium]|nr:hypothetical protein [Pyrinomonadaceae bacterium]